MTETFANTPRDSRNVKRYIQLSALWALVFVGCTFALAFDFIAPQPFGWLLAFVPSVFAWFMVRAYWRYLNEMDELLRVIELKALALAVAAGSVVWPAIEILEGALDMDIDVPVTLLVMTGFYSFGLIRGRMAHL